MHPLLGTSLVINLFEFAEVPLALVKAVADGDPDDENNDCCSSAHSRYPY